MSLETWFCLAALVVDPAVGVFDVIAFDAQIADCTLALATYTILTLYRRFGEYETMGELFRIMQADLMALTLWQRILPLYSLCHLLGADFEQTMQTLQAGGDESEEIVLMISMLPVVNKDE